MKTVWVLIGLFVLTYLALLILGVYKSEYPFNKHQSMDTLRSQYYDCLDKAPKGFTCAATFVMVSERYLANDP